MSIHDEQPELAAWIESTIGGPIVKKSRQGRWRVQWMLDVEGPDGVAELLARMPRDPDFVRFSEFLSHYDIEREGHVLDALAGTGLPINRCYGFHAPSQTLLIDRVEGSGDFFELGEDDRERVLNSYIDQLVALHSLDRSVFDEVDTSRPEPAKPAGQLQFMRRDYDQARASMRPEPLLDFSLWWLDNHLPASAERRSVVQGDTGPGQFMFRDGELVALIDWELADIDHPMLDLGVMRMRNVLYPLGPLDSALNHYAQLTGTALDLEAIRYFTVVASLVSPLGMAQSMQAPSALIDSMLPRFAWDVTMRRALCEALLEASGIAPSPVELPEPVVTSRTFLHDFLVEHLEFGCADVADDDFERFLLGGATGLAKATRFLDQVGDQLDADDLDDIASVVGTRPTDRTHGDQLLADIVARDPEAHTEALLLMWHRMSVRREYGWGPLMVAQGSGPLVPMRDDLGQLVP